MMTVVDAGPLYADRDILTKYRDMRPNFADDSLVALCERRGLRRIASIDRDFGKHQTLTNEPFENLLAM